MCIRILTAEPNIGSEGLLLSAKIKHTPNVWAVEPQGNGRPLRSLHALTISYIIYFDTFFIRLRLSMPRVHIEIWLYLLFGRKGGAGGTGKQNRCGSSLHLRCPLLQFLFARTVCTITYTEACDECDIVHDRG